MFVINWNFNVTYNLNLNANFIGDLFQKGPFNKEFTIIFISFTLILKK
jgi:hypothetical protein